MYNLEIEIFVSSFERLRDNDYFDKKIDILFFFFFKEGVYKKIILG